MTLMPWHGVLFLVLLLVLSCNADDDEVVLVEDISDDEDDLSKSYVKANLSEVSPKEKKSPSPPPADSASKAKSDVPSHQNVLSSIQQVEQLINSLEVATRDYNQALFDADHIESMAKIRQEAYTTATRSLAEASRGTKVDKAAFQPLVDQLLRLQNKSQQMKKVLQDQVGLHLELMQRTQDILQSLSTKSNKALRAYVNQRLKKRKPSSRENLLEMQALQRSTRSTWWLGASTRELRGVFMFSLVYFMIFSLGKMAAHRFAGLKQLGPLLDFVMALTCCLMGYYFNMVSVSAYLSTVNKLLQAACLLFLTGCYTLLQQQVELLLRDFLFKQGRRKSR